MAGLNVSGLAGAASNLVTALSKEKSLEAFMDTMSDFGVQVANNFEVNFSGIPGVTFFIQDIELPGLKQNFGEVHYDGRIVDIPVNHEFNHDFSITVLNDANGYIYSLLTNFILAESTNTLANSGYTMTVRARNGNDKWPGMLITCRGVRFETLNGLSFGQSKNEVQSFSIAGKLIDFTVTPGALATAAGIAGTVTSIIG